ncbi:MAG: hypothetical protein PHT95_02285 [Candidatus Omnitrophica bacterium]|nr:hypothetical protein [Candidatus Omnitrophota bacterium]MDD4013678.1 hypothetical protein [Candidatus Omnitrophota bacterium]
MGIMEAVKKGFSETGKLMNVVMVFFIFNVVIGLVSLPLADPARAGNPGIVAVSIISSLLFFLIFIFLQGGALGMVKDQIKTASASMAQFNEYGKKYYLRILGLLLLYILIAIGVVLLLSLISAGVLLMGDNVVTRSIVAAIVTVAAVIIITMLIYPIYAVVVDDAGPFQALKNGMSAAKSNFWKTFGLFVVLLVISLIISLVIGFVIGLITVPLSPNVSQILIAIVNAAVQSYIPIVMMVAFMGTYMGLIAEKK